MIKQTIAAALFALVSGCASETDPFRNKPNMDEIYEAVNPGGAQDTVRLLREGLRARPALGSTEPYYPIRNPDVVAPVWVVPYADPKTGVKHGGRWDYIIVEEADWAN